MSMQRKQPGGVRQVAGILLMGLLILLFVLSRSCRAAHWSLGG
jgi:hypothetical protein